MSVLAREARREHIQQIMRLINASIRPQLQRAIDETMLRSASRDGCSCDRLGGQIALDTHTTGDLEQPSILSPDDDAYPNTLTPEPGTESSSPPTRRATSTDVIAVSKTGCPSNTTDDHPTTSLDSSSIKGCTAEKPERRIIIDGPLAANASESHKHGTSGSDPTRLQALPLDESVLSRIALSVRYLRSGRDIPNAIFEGATHHDMSVLDCLYQALRRMVQAIDRSVAAMVDTATARFDKHMASLKLQPSSARRPRHFQGEEEWQTGRGKRTQWNPNADWGSDMVWSEVEVKEGEPVRQRPGSRLRHAYIPCEWDPPPPEPRS